MECRFAIARAIRIGFVTVGFVRALPNANLAIGFFVEGRFTAATADSTGGLTDEFTDITATIAGTQELNVFTVNGGIRIFF